MTAIAALEAKVGDASTHYNCPGYFQLGNVRFRCWKKSGHGNIGMQKAIEQSCNAYFCQLGKVAGIGRIYSAADFFGFGHITGIDLDGEKRGLMPNDEWKRRARGDGWRLGDTCNVSIGQGALLVTPLQMALFASALGNRGFIFKPRLVARNPDQGELLRRMTWSASTMQVVRGGMHDVIQADSGTGKRARVSGVEMAGKTGTAEYGSRENRKKNTWMIVFAPYDNPRYAMAVIVQDGESGGRTVAPIIHNVMSAVFQREKMSMAGGGI
jgi:penicillin-binding protein 2